MIEKNELILTLNCGSSSIKYSVWEMPVCNIICSGIVERVTFGGSFINHNVSGKEKVIEEHECSNHEEAIKLIISYLVHPRTGVLKKINEIKAVGHRVVHGGEEFTKSVVINNKVKNKIRELFRLAPLHNPPNLMGIEASMRLFPNIPNIACWDTAFSAPFLPKKAYTYAIPFEYSEKYGIRRYGYHGLSHLYVSKRASVLLNKKTLKTNLVTIHIGNGASVTAVKNGVAIDQSLGFSTCGEGIVMGTRCGDLDPEVPLTLMEFEGLSIKEVRNILYYKSGVLGISGKYADRRDIIKAAQNEDERSRLALDIECYRLKKYIGAYYALINKIDAIVFTAGVGENSWLHREKSCENLEALGIEIDKNKNKKVIGRSTGESDISTSGSKVKIFVIPTDEELVIAADVFALLNGKYDIHTNFIYPFEKKDFIPSYLR